MNENKEKKKGKKGIKTGEIEIDKTETGKGGIDLAPGAGTGLETEVMIGREIGNIKSVEIVVATAISETKENDVIIGGRAVVLESPKMCQKPFHKKNNRNSKNRLWQIF